ncbi:myelin-oligodendrocyte glycoprotein-like [Nycticebus coucang]|uniref:myelin-oligodendrocyte glycoprotein-like n=1 Tax=Nycticebus coucang TaxID=9470 RepID=UPI00234D4B79|nr:myelin-oligodendrocyte glycoprotein-like [Nycticebus coucang]
MNAEDMEVTWHHNGLEGVVYYHGNIQNNVKQQTQEYQGRTEFLKENITKGQVALRIHPILPSDEGEYSCFFISSTQSSSAKFLVLVTGFLGPSVVLLGADPLGPCAHPSAVRCLMLCCVKSHCVRLRAKATCSDTVLHYVYLVTLGFSEFSYIMWFQEYISLIHSSLLEMLRLAVVQESVTTRDSDSAPES